MVTGRPTRCRCAELGELCQACTYEAARIEDRDLGDPMLPGDYDRLEAGPWWNYTPGMAS